LAPPFVFVFLTPSFCLLFVWPAIFNNKSKSKKKGFVWFAAWFVVVTGTKQKASKEKEDFNYRYRL